MERRHCLDRSVMMHRDNEGDEPSIVGTASRFYDKDSPGTEFELWPNAVEHIMTTAFDNYEQDDVRALFNHDANQLLGRSTSGTLEMDVRFDGLHYKVDPPDTTVGRDVMSMLHRGDISGSSFAFQVTDDQWRKEDGVDVREILGVKLFDVGPVTYPAYPATSAGVRSNAFRDREYIEDARESHRLFCRRRFVNHNRNRLKVAEATLWQPTT